MRRGVLLVTSKEKRRQSEFSPGEKNSKTDKKRKRGNTWLSLQQARGKKAKNGKKLYSTVRPKI